MGSNRKVVGHVNCGSIMCKLQYSKTACDWACLQIEPQPYYTTLGSIKSPEGTSLVVRAFLISSNVTDSLYVTSADSQIFLKA